MHAYATDSGERKYIPFFLAGAAFAASYILSTLLAIGGWSVPFWLPSLDVLGFYGLFYWLFDEFGWRLKILHQLGAVRVPVLSGKWEMAASPTDTTGPSIGKTATSAMQVVIRQRWQSISITGESDLSRFWSISGYLQTDGNPVLGYEYINEPAMSAPDTMQIHHGTVRLSLSEDGKSLRGEYYSGRSRQNIGELVLTRRP